jgi:DNA polymerase-3 subunit delta'
MNLNSQVIITSEVEDTLRSLHAQVSTETLIKIAEEEKAFSVDDAKMAIQKAYMASEEMTVIILIAKVFSPIVQNKLLKIIEEPPKNKAFILITESQSTLLDTIRSRLPVRIISRKSLGNDLGLEVSMLSLALVYDFVQRHKRTSSKEMLPIIEQIARESMSSGKFDLDTKTLALFSDCIHALDMGSPAVFILNTLLLKLLARKKR